MAGEEESRFTPAMWGLFSLGGFVVAFLLPVLLVLNGLAYPLGLWQSDRVSYRGFSAVAGTPLGRLFFLVIIAGSLFHALHRLKYVLVDFGIRNKAALDGGLYGLAILGTATAVYLTWVSEIQNALRPEALAAAPAVAIFVVLFTLALAAVPSQVLLLDVLGKLPAPRTLRLAGVPALVAFVALVLLFYSSNRVLLGAAGLGIAAGIAATFALDSVRIPGYLLRWMPMDLPMRLGTMVLGLDTKLKLRVMNAVLGHVNDQLRRGVPPSELMNAAGFPKLPMRVMRGILGPSFREALKESQVSSWKVRASGYLWHYTNGASFGVIHALLFGASWPFTIGFGLLLAGTFIAILRFMIPPMRPGRRMPTVILLAHIGVILVFGFVFQTYLSPGASDLSLVGQIAKLLQLR